MLKKAASHILSIIACALNEIYLNALDASFKINLKHRFYFNVVLALVLLVIFSLVFETFQNFELCPDHPKTRQCSALTFSTCREKDDFPMPGR